MSTFIDPPKPTSTKKITILVVDDDATSLAIVAAMLRQWHYEVTTARSPHDALFTLRARPGIDLVVTDLHMPHMDGLQLHRQINEEFKLPVIIMSSDDKESVMLHCLACGVVFYIVKPVYPDDLKNVWQYAIQAKSGKAPIIEEVESSEGESSQDNSKTTPADDQPQGENSGSSSVNNIDGDKQAKNDDKKKRKGKRIVEKKKTFGPRKAKVVWTNSLHNRFLQAIRHIGLDRAVPKKILDCMNVPGLTRENVASHLQKYRIFLKRVAEKGLCPSKTLTERALRSTFAACHAMMLQNAQQQQMGGLNFQPGYEGYGGSNTLTSTPIPNSSSNFLTLRFPGQAASGSSSGSNPPTGPSLPGHQYGYGQSSLWYNQGNMQQPLFGNTISLNYQANHPSFRVGSSNYGSNFSGNGGMINPSPNGLINGANLNPMHVYPQQGTQARTNIYNAGNGINSFALYQFGASDFTHFGAPNPRSQGNTYSGTRMTRNGEFGLDQFQFNNTTNDSASTGGYGNGNMNVASMLGNGNSSNVVQGSSFSAGFDQVPNQMSSSLPTLATNNHTSQLPHTQEGLFGHGAGGENEFNLDNFLNNASLFDDNVIVNLFDSTNLEFPNQQQGADNLGDLNQIVNQTLNPSLSDTTGSCLVDGNHSWNEQAIGQATQNQIQGGDQLVNNSTPGGNISPLVQLLFDQNANQPQNGGEITNLGVNNRHLMNNASQNQGSGDDFLDFLFGFGR
ncbi:hypothetical protein SLEP1_g3538 [Rubroshorea leprosula]|uniref:Two-component response regulator n=1 Tax=Rubroshorea leprosula TaxID=152421 RepID=A0AAV5HS76_9ROSI|nr:hypothetical protein SLEP1_g3538 [Rubroshorea leprosula]